MKEHMPYVPADTVLKDFNPKTVILGVILGAIFGSANAYLGLRVGLTISTAIPLAVVSVAILTILTPIFGKPSILECNISQTTGSASSSLASGLIFTIPALYLWNYDAPLLQITLLAMCGGLLGVLFMIPLRNFLIVKEHHTLPYPEGTASAEVLIAATGGADCCYGGIGWCGHIAFWESSLGHNYDSLDEWKQAKAQIVELTPMTIMQNALHSFGGDWSWVPPKAATIAPADILGARHRSFWLDGVCGPDMAWERFIARLAAHCRVNRFVPGSILQTVPTDYTLLGGVADNVEIDMA